ncbi:hypothetical protein MBANPS3_012714, partial [Mucor bainieri]
IVQAYGDTDSTSFINKMPFHYFDHLVLMALYYCPNDLIQPKALSFSNEDFVFKGNTHRLTP